MKELAKEMEHGDMKQNEMKQLMQELQAMSQALQVSKLQTASNKMSEASKQMQGEGMKLKLDPETLKKLAKMMREAGEACKGGGKMTLDAEKLAELLQALKEGRLKLSSGSGMGLPIPLPGMGGQKGNGSGGKGYKGTPNNSDLAGLPKTVAVGKSNNITADSRASKEFLKYAAMGHKDSKFKPNTQVKGAWNNSHSELQQQFKGDPDSGYVAGTPLYDANQTGVRAIENPVAREQIPAAYRRQVKDYFQAITGNK